MLSNFPAPTPHSPLPITRWHCALCSAGSEGNELKGCQGPVGLCDWKHIVWHFNIYDKMPGLAGLYLTSTDSRKFFFSFFLISFIFNCVSHLRQRASSILEHTKILRYFDVLRPTSVGIFPLKFPTGFLRFRFLISFGICALVSLLFLYWLLSTSTAALYINRKYRSWVLSPTRDKHVGKLNQTVNRLDGGARSACSCYSSSVPRPSCQPLLIVFPWLP